jgi:hypothetical protein
MLVAGDAVKTQQSYDDISGVNFKKNVLNAGAG